MTSSGLDCEACLVQFPGI